MSQDSLDGTFCTTTCPLCGNEAPSVAGVQVCLETNTALVDGQQIKLTGREAEILFVLADMSPHVVGKDFLLERLYAHHADEPASKVFDVHVCRLRRKLAGIDIDIRTIWGRGWQLARREKEAA